MKQLKEMNYFELLDLEAWCENIIEKIGANADYYVELKERAAAARHEISVNRCLEQFWKEKIEQQRMFKMTGITNNNNQKENN